MLNLFFRQYTIPKKCFWIVIFCFNCQDKNMFYFNRYFKDMKFVVAFLNKNMEAIANMLQYNFRLR